MAEVDATTHRVRATFPDRGGVLSPWLDVLTPDAHAVKVFGLPSVGAQVAVLMDEREESGAILGVLFSEADPVPEASTATVRRLLFGDGASIAYDPATKAAAIALPEGATLALVFGGGGSITYETESGTLEVVVPGGSKVKLAGDEDDIALAGLVLAELNGVRSALDSHTHLAGALVAPGGGGPVTGTSGTASSGYSPASVAAAQLRSA